MCIQVGKGVYASMEETIQVWKRSVYKYEKGVYTNMKKECIQVCKWSVYTSIEVVCI